MWWLIGGAAIAWFCGVPIQILLLLFIALGVWVLVCSVLE